MNTRDALMKLADDLGIEVTTNELAAFILQRFHADARQLQYQLQEMDRWDMDTTQWEGACGKALEIMRNMLNSYERVLKARKFEQKNE